ncbi:hypothetical protein AJ79_03914 [Helicocarpus griseus UAMH5409]|uniref:tRNA (guanine(37)-N1)-methyltransferase n=1 Tax=Helicocarpus griseus UAMH5409 TaxID=1447875 RepID=A0A2B7XX61_9EURO|nr:hypothetical protein AJ79_03914 [Helicocarpus griseus UAMH5409]
MEQAVTAQDPSSPTSSPALNPVANPSTPTTPSPPPSPDADMFRPPVNRMMRMLDRSFFKKTVPLSAATVFETKNISPIRQQLLESKDLLKVNNIIPVRTAREGELENVVDHWYTGLKLPGRRCLLLQPSVKADDTATWSPTIQELVERKAVELRPFKLLLDYDYFTYKDIMEAVLPIEELEELPVGFTQVGHVAHFNLRDEALPYKHLIGEVIKDKHPNIHTVINKTDEVGERSEFRTFTYEVLAGRDDMNVTIREQNCEFSFDYSQVYWNTRLGTEHERIVNRFKPGEAVCDVMAGVGPFSIPAGKKDVFVWANDLNPHGYERLTHAAHKNKVKDYVQTSNMDGREFIRYATKQLYSSRPKTVAKRVKIDPSKSSPRKKSQYFYINMTSPRTFDHYVMNLPATAIDFLGAFNGVYAGQEKLFHPNTNRKMPFIHVYCFSTNSEDLVVEREDICQRISKSLGYTITPEDYVGGKGDPRIELEIRDVRIVSPTKLMFCASFRLPAEVAFKKA